MQRHKRGKEKEASVVIVMPAYNAEKTIEKTFRDIPRKYKNNVIVIDDDSKDQTVSIAKKLKLSVFIHKKNLGYGGNQKTCYKKALSLGAEIIVMIHPDYQYDATLTDYMVRPIKEGRFDIMLGSRIRSRKEALGGGMPLYKYLSNRLLTFLENIVLGLNLSEYHTGFRAYKKEVVQNLPIDEFSNDFIFDQQVLISAANAGFTIGEIAVPVRYFEEASSINFIRSLKYGLGVIYILFLYTLNNLGVKNKIFEIKS